MRLASFVATLARPPLPAGMAQAVPAAHTPAGAMPEQGLGEEEPPAPGLSIEEFVHLARLAGAL